jgi:precorrin-3B methylase
MERDPSMASGTSVGPVTEYLMRLAINPLEAEAARRDFDATTDKLIGASLSTDDRETLKSQDPVRIRDRILQEMRGRKHSADKRVEPQANFVEAGGSLTVVGTGIRAISDVTIEAKNYLERATKVLCLAADPLTYYWIKIINPTAESLTRTYRTGRPRSEIYAEQLERVMSYVRKGLRVCLATYGHPGVFASMPHEAKKLAQSEGYPATMLPAVSAQDWLFANLGVDPGVGHQSFDATDFIANKRSLEPRYSTVFFQIGMIGVFDYKETIGNWNPPGLHYFAEVLQKHYPPSHEVVVYEAAVYPLCNPRVETIALSRLAEMPVSVISTLYVPPLTFPQSAVSAVPFGQNV